MADLSLDEFIRQKNVKVQIRNPSQQRPQQNQARGQQKGFGTNAKFQVKQPVKHMFDARSKLGPKAVVDARNKIITNNKGGKGDARNKIVQIQVQKGTFDARSLLKNQKQGKNKTNGAVKRPQPQPQPGFPGAQPLTRTLSNPMGQMGNFQVTRQVPNTEVTLTRDSMQITKRTMSGARPPPAPPSIGDAVPIIQIRNDRYQSQQPPPPQLHHPPPPPPPPQQQQQQQQLSWSNQAPLFARPQPAHQDVAYSQHHSSSSLSSARPPFMSSSSSSSSSQSHRRYQDLDDPDFHSTSISSSSLGVHNIPKMHISNIKAVEAAGMRPVSSSSTTRARPGLLQPRAPPGAATLSSRQPLALSQQSSSGGVKRRQPPVAQEVGGPLRLGKGGGPGLQVGIGEVVSPPKRARPGIHPVEPIEILDEDNSKFVSPIQGFRVVVTNLFSGVTQDDIIELFGVVGPLKKARLLKAGSAEVVYTTREDASKAVTKYNGRELDGQPMHVKMTTPATAVVKAPMSHDPDITGEALRLYKKPSSLGALPEAPIEVPTIHRALFKVGPPAPNKSVKFTVKI